jgi:hypothetical protein
MTDTDVTFLQYYGSCPYIRHDLYLPSIPASLQTLGRVECAVAGAPAPPGLRTISPLTLTLISQCLLDAYKNLALSSSSHLPTVASVFVLAHPPWPFPPLLLPVASTLAKVFLPLIFPPLEVCLFLSFVFYLAPRVCQTLGPFPRLRV